MVAATGDDCDDGRRMMMESGVLVAQMWSAGPLKTRLDTRGQNLLGPEQRTGLNGFAVVLRSQKAKPDETEWDCDARMRRCSEVYRREWDLGYEWPSHHCVWRCSRPR